MRKFAVVDLESTDRDPSKAHVVEWAVLEIPPPWFGDGDLPTMHVGLVRPPIPIPPETSAVHHIIDADVRDEPMWEEAQQRVIPLFDAETIAVAHNANYERTMLAGLNLPCRWICTYKAAVRVWPDCPSFSNECLRYYLGLGEGRSVSQATHSAVHDALVTSKILRELLRLNTPIEDMLAWTEQPALLPVCPLGDWRGHKWADVEESFLHWIVRKITDREDVRFCAQTELARRAKEDEELRAAQRLALQRRAIQGAAADNDIPF